MILFLEEKNQKNFIALYPVEFELAFRAVTKKNKREECCHTGFVEKSLDFRKNP